MNANHTLSTPRSSRLRRLSALLLGLLLILFGSGCATISLITEVMRDAQGDHADVTLRIKVDPAVAVEAQLRAESFAEAPAALRPGWSYSGNGEQWKMVFSRRYETLEELSGLPDELQNLADDFSIDFVRGILVTTEPSSDGLDYFFDATIVVPDPGEEDASPQRGCSYEAQSLGEFIACSVNPEMSPALQAAIDKAGPPLIQVEIAMPGALRRMRVNNADSGTRLDEGRVRWEFNAAQQATYEISATSLPYHGGESAEELLDQALSDDVGFQGLTAAADIDKARKDAALDRAKALTRNLRSRLPASLSRADLYQIELAFVRANFLANLSDANGKPLFPIFRAAAPIIARMALNAGTDENARVAVGRLVELLIAQESQRIERMKQ